MLNLLESLVQYGSKVQTRQGEPLVNDLDFFPVIDLVDQSVVIQPRRLRIPV